MSENFKYSNSERQFNLLLALSSSSYGLKKIDIFEKVLGYQFKEEKSSATLDKMFERDKKALEDSGYKINILYPKGQEEVSQEIRYYIPKTTLHWPRDIIFSELEILIMILAISVWEEGNLSDLVRNTFYKIISLKAKSKYKEKLLNKYVENIDTNFATFHSAIQLQKACSFMYFKPDSHPQKRNVFPVKLLKYEDNWLLYAYDLDFDAWRTFMLKRVSGKILVYNFSRKIDVNNDYVETLNDELEQIRNKNELEIYLKNNTIAQLVFVSKGAKKLRDEIYLYNSSDIADFISKIASYGKNARILNPDNVANKYHEHINKILEYYDG